MSNKELNFKIYWEDITDRPEKGNYQLYHYGELEFLDESFPFTLVEMHDENIGYTSYEVTWVEGSPDNFVSELEKEIENSLEDEFYKKEQEEIAEHKRLKDIDDEKSWNGIK
jgi:hypothetical protein